MFELQGWRPVRAEFGEFDRAVVSVEYWMAFQIPRQLQPILGRGQYAIVGVVGHVDAAGGGHGFGGRHGDAEMADRRDEGSRCPTFFPSRWLGVESARASRPERTRARHWRRGSSSRMPRTRVSRIVEFRQHSRECQDKIVVVRGVAHLPDGGDKGASNRWAGRQGRGGKI